MKAPVLQGSAGTTRPAWTGTGCPKLAVLVYFLGVKFERETSGVERKDLIRACVYLFWAPCSTWSKYGFVYTITETGILL